MLIIRVIIDSTVLCVVLHSVHRNFQKVQLLGNAFGVFREFHRGHFSPDFRAQGATLKSKALATKCIFQIYSQLLDICTQLVLKTANELILPSVIYTTYKFDRQKDKTCTSIKFHECSFHKIKRNLSKYCHMVLKCSLHLVSKLSMWVYERII